MIQRWSSHGSYFRHSTGQPLVSTFEGPGNAADWNKIKATTGAFFVPDWSSLGAKKAVARGNGVADGLFNWGAWPEGTQRTNWDLDASYLIFLNQKKSRTYMASVSPWFFTNMPGFNKNWLWQGGTLWYDRWQQLASLGVIGEDHWPNQPEYIQIISWNDYGESHYIGPLNEKAYLACGKGYGNAPFNYALGHPHDGWRHMLPYMINLWKSGTAVVTEEVLTAWYRLTPSRACASGGTTGNNPDQLQTATDPWSISEDRVYFSALLTGLLTPRVTIGGHMRVINWDTVPDYGTTGFVGVYFGSAETGGVAGEVKIELLDSNSKIVATLNGEPIKATCPNSVMNWNAWVGSTTGARAVKPTSPKTNLKDQQCIDGSGSKSEFDELCEFTCVLGYCPPGPCTCYRMSKVTNNLKPKKVDGYPVPGSDCTYAGLCSFACNYGRCPPGTCTTDPTAKGKCVIPAPEPDQDVQCTSGAGSGNLAGLCDYACGRGYCPRPPCTCTGRGPAITPPPVTDKPGWAADGLSSQDYDGLCNFACSRGYCPEGACT